VYQIYIYIYVIREDDIFAIIMFDSYYFDEFSSINFLSSSLECSVLLNYMRFPSLRC
jgi:hypothetical protein